MAKEYTSIFGPPSNCPAYWTTPEELRRFREQHPGMAVRVTETKYPEPVSPDHTEPDEKLPKTQSATSMPAEDTSKDTSAASSHCRDAEDTKHNDGR